jgi:fructokinase
MNPPPVVIGLGEILWDVYPDEARFGGAPANFAIQAAALGAEAWTVGSVGADDLGRRALERLRERAVRCETVQQDAIHPTGTVAVTLDESGKATYQFAADTAWDHLDWSDAVSGVAARCDAVCFGTLGQRSPRSRQTIRRFVQATPAAALRVFDVNLRQTFYDADTLVESLRLATVLKLNDEELPVVARLCGLQTAAPRDQLAELLRRFDLRLIALTRGGEGSLLATPTELNGCPAPPTDLVDTVGAGDAFTATLVMGLLADRPLSEINRHANAVAAYVCSQKGASPVLPDHLKIPSRTPIDGHR